LAMGVAFSIRDTTASGRSFVMTVTGNLDRATAHTLEERLRLGPLDLAGDLVLDLTHVGDVDDSCIRLVAARSVEATANGRQLRVIAREGPVLAAFESAGLGYLVDVDRRAVVRR